MAEENLEQQEAEQQPANYDPPPETGEDHGPDASEEISPESLASELGWCPKEEWRGNPDEWKPAADFLKSTVDINKSLRKDLKATREASERAARAAAAITEKAIHEERMRLLAARHEAIEMADPETAYMAEQQLMRLPVQQAPGPVPEAVDFAQRNAKWYGIDPIASQIAWNVCEAKARAGVSDPNAQLEAAEKEVRRRFPEYFEAPKKAPASVETDGSRAAGHFRRGTKGFNELPADAKRAALDFEKRGRASRDEYAQLYWQENA